MGSEARPYPKSVQSAGPSQMVMGSGVVSLPLKAPGPTNHLYSSRQEMCHESHAHCQRRISQAHRQTRLLSSHVYKISSLPQPTVLPLQHSTCQWCSLHKTTTNQPGAPRQIAKKTLLTLGMVIRFLKWEHSGKVNNCSLRYSRGSAMWKSNADFICYQVNTCRQ